MLASGIRRRLLAARLQTYPTTCYQRRVEHRDLMRARAITRYWSKDHPVLRRDLRYRPRASCIEARAWTPDGAASVLRLKYKNQMSG